MNKNLISGFGLKLPEKEQVKAKIKKVKEEIKITKRNTISSKLPLSEKLTIIKVSYSNKNVLTISIKCLSG